MFKKLFRILVKIISVIFLFILLILFPYTITPVYQFPEPKPFTGEKLYNPYSNTDFATWQRINFHAHSSYWGNIGITNANQNSPENIYKAYHDELGYTMPGVSDYQHINYTLDTMPAFIASYEHGFNINRVHQLPVNAKRVTWLDYPLTQGLNQKQHVINALHRQSDFVILAHPNLDNGYLPEEVAKLTQFQAVEILNTFNYWGQAQEQWDAALSAGNYVLAVGDDDLHDLGKYGEFGYRFSSVGTESKKSEDLLRELKKGNHLIVGINRESGDNLSIKKQKLKGVEQRITSFTVSEDSLTVTVDYPTHYICFIGQNGTILSKESGVKELTYIMQPGDAYARAEIHYKDHTNVYMNPVARYSEEAPTKHNSAKVNILITIIYIALRISIWLALFSILLIKVIIRWR